MAIFHTGLRDDDDAWITSGEYYCDLSGWLPAVTDVPLAARARLYRRHVLIAAAQLRFM